MTLYRWIFALAAMLAFSGCAYPPPQPQPPPPAATPAASAETLAALEQLTDLKEELKKLRNAVEEILFDAESTTRRQHNLFQDMDRRLLSLERTQRLLSLPPAASVDGNIGALPGVIPGVIPGIVEGGVTNGIAGATADVALVAGGTAAIETPAPAVSGDAEAPIETVSVQEQEAYNRAFDLLKKSKYQEAIDQFQQMADTWPDSQLADDAYYWMSEARYVNREFEAALSGFRTVVNRYPKSQRAPDALLKIGYIRYDVGSYEKAAEVFRDILARFPGHQVAVSAKTRLRRIEQTIQ